MVAKPPTSLLKKGILFVWTGEHEVAFTSGTRIGVVLSQNRHPLAFVSKALGPRNKGLDAYEKEYLALILAMDQWRQYLQNSEFVIYSDHRSLSHLTKQKLHTPWQQKMLSKLIGLQYRIVYKKGSDNGAAFDKCSFVQFIFVHNTMDAAGI